MFKKKCVQESEGNFRITRPKQRELPLKISVKQSNTEEKKACNHEVSHVNCDCS